MPERLGIPDVRKHRIIHMHTARMRFIALAGITAFIASAAFAGTVGNPATVPEIDNPQHWIDPGRSVVFTAANLDEKNVEFARVEVVTDPIVAKAEIEGCVMTLHRVTPGVPGLHRDPGRTVGGISIGFMGCDFGTFGYHRDPGRGIIVRY
jgi:hypothetical protein